jgi:uncharacterized membrane protein
MSTDIPKPLGPRSSARIAKPWPMLSVALAVALIILGLAWELVLDPIRPGGSWLALKVLPLVIALKGLYQGRLFTFQWMSLLIWLYVGEALVRIIGLSATERILAWNSLALSTALALVILMGARKKNRLSD